MKREEILQVFAMLAQSQGFYGRLIQSIMSADEDRRDEFLYNLEQQNFTDAVQLVMYLES